jgi:hypothetical protein
MADVSPSHTVPRRAEGLLECELLDELLLHVPGDPVAIALNASARAVWELCDGGRSIETIALDLTQRFEAAPGEILAAVQEVVRELTRLRLLQLPEAAGSRGLGP